MYNKHIICLKHVIVKINHKAQFEKNVGLILFTDQFRSLFVILEIKINVNEE